MILFYLTKDKVKKKTLFKGGLFEQSRYKIW
ncbi:hypothetical protein GGR06_002455 [Bacteroides reticulotermitis]|uniref:Uncharacterized protein n=1 Tax=Bacteroides reticulotermitis TaxID=1133319 RepID=A0A840CXQ3_9BACE|nr:hypothetical protein [Bacteroides reticulotermitis]